MRSRLSPVTAGAAAGLALVLTLSAAQTATAAGQTWRDVSPTTGAGSILRDVESSGTTAWAVGGVLGTGKSPETLLAVRWTGRGWERSVLPAEHGRLLDVSGGAHGQPWAAGAETLTTAEGQSSHALLVSRQHGSWRRAALPLPATATDSGLDALDTTADGQVWAYGWYATEEGGVNILFHRDTAGTWTTLPADTGLNWVDSIEAGEDGTLTATGDGISRFDGRSWARQALPDDNTVLAGIEIRSAHDIWAVGFHPDEELWRRPAIMRFDGKSWREIPAPQETGQLYDIAFDGSGRPVIVGETADTTVDEDGDYVLTRDRSGAFTRTESPSGAGYLYGASTDPSGRVWSVGGAAGAVGGVSPAAYAGLRG
ncbi:hypothetical protein [Streptomyces sp. bgisy091]|uniref:hypothetical protein n=1 Tax=Streptomyces sp. bgisy091 TaxID=3413778 RepID=UPI003D74B63A